MKKRIFVLTCLLLTVPCQGRTITVDDDGPADFNNIQAAIDDANNGDTIIVADGIYTGPGNRDISFQSKAITIRSTDPNDPNIVANTIIDCENVYSGFRFSGLEGTNTILDGFTITRAWASSEGAAIYSGLPGDHYAQAIIRHCNITDCNSGSSGGVIWGWDGLIEDCNFEDNKATIVCRGTLKNCIIRNSSCVPLCSMGEVINCVISDNAYFVMGRKATIKNSTIENNGLYGIDVSGGPATIQNSIIWGHSTDIHQYCTKDSVCGPLTVEFSIFGTLSTNLPDTLQVHSCINTDPCFADPCNSDYHLKSQAGRWNPNSQTWVQDDVTSVAIDAGNPMNPVGLEPFPNGGIINMGAYGGTTEASKSYFGGSPCQTIVAGDINGDCVVDFKDFGLMAIHWLDSNN